MLPENDCRPRTRRHHLPITIKVNNADVNINTMNHGSHHHTLAQAQGQHVSNDARDVGGSSTLNVCCISRVDQGRAAARCPQDVELPMTERSPALSIVSSSDTSQDVKGFLQSTEEMRSYEPSASSPQLSLASYKRRMEARQSSPAWSTITGESTERSFASSLFNLPDVEEVGAHIKKLRLSSDCDHLHENSVNSSIDANDISFRTATTLVSNTRAARFQYAATRDPLLGEPLVPSRSSHLSAAELSQTFNHLIDDVSLPTLTSHRMAATLIHDARIARFREVEPHSKSRFRKARGFFTLLPKSFNLFECSSSPGRRKSLLDSLANSENGLATKKSVIRWSACSSLGSRTVAMFDHALTAWFHALEGRVRFVHTEEHNSGNIQFKRGRVTRGYLSGLASVATIRVPRGCIDYYSLLNEIGLVLGL